MKFHFIILAFFFSCMLSIDLKASEQNLTFENSWYEKPGFMSNKLLEEQSFRLTYSTSPTHHFIVTQQNKENDVLGNWEHGQGNGYSAFGEDPWNNLDMHGLAWNAEAWGVFFKAFGTNLAKEASGYNDVKAFANKPGWGTGLMALSAFPPMKPLKGAKALKCLAKTGSSSATKSLNQISKLIKTGKAPKGIIRIDKGKVKGEIDHIHFSDGSALNKNGTWKHGSKSLNNKEKSWLKSVGWKLP